MYSLQTVEHVASRLALKKQRIYQLVRDDFFPTGVVIRFGKSIRFNESRLIAFLENGDITDISIHSRDARDTRIEI